MAINGLTGSSVGRLGMENILIINLFGFAYLLAQEIREWIFWVLKKKFSIEILQPFMQIYE